MVGATGVLAAAERGGWIDSTQMVIVRAPLEREAGNQTVVVSKPVVAQGFDPQQIYANHASGVVTVFASYPQNGRLTSVEQGSGFIVSRSGVIITAAHVIVSASAKGIFPRPARKVEVEFRNGARAPATIIGWDPYDDVGVLRVEQRSRTLDPLPLGALATLKVGQAVAAIGSPFGNRTSLSVGVISGLNRTIPSLIAGYDLLGAIQTDAPINPGSSGGPLLDGEGAVIGINAQIRAPLGSGFDGVSFAVPASAIRRSLNQILARSQVPYARLGLETETLTPAIARRYGYAVDQGALIREVDRNGAAARAGLRGGTERVHFGGHELTVGGDAIVAIDGQRVVSSAAAAGLVAESLVPGEVAWFTVVRRGGVRVVLPVILGARTG